jgi:ABC-type Fe3+/spermidine/putrescine transport system ATPase subunit
MISIEGLTRVFQTKSEKVHAIDGVSFEVGAGEMVTLLGPSGCGKTTTLRCVAGLDRPNSGRISINNKIVMSGSETGTPVFIPPQKRNLGMVFQSYAVWPHMTVFQNVAYALGGRRLARSEVRRLVMKALAMVKLEAYADRPAPRLSGGQQQRVAIARAIAGNPQALLFDEPLSNLDAKLRADMRNEIRRLQQQVGLTSIYVTHDQSEALTISDWIIVMRNGKIVERGRPTEIYRYPKNIFTAHFIGHTNLIPGKVQNIDKSYVSVETDVGRLLGIDTNKNLKVGDDVEVSVRPEDMTSVAIADGSPANAISGVIDFSIFAGAIVEAELKMNDRIVQCTFGRDETLSKGEQKTLHFKADDCVVLLADKTLRQEGDFRPA